MDVTIDGLLAWKVVAVLAWLALFFAAERLRPAAREATGGAIAGGWRRVARNLGLWLANAGLSPLVVLPVSLWAAQNHLGWRPVWWSGPGGLLLDLVLLDFLIFWWHLANHKVPLLWRFHEVHHLDRFLDTTTALRFHFGEVLLSAFARAGVIVVLGLPISSVLVFETLVLAAAIFHHSNLGLARGSGAGAGAPCHHPVDSLGASSRRAAGHRRQLRHDLQFLGSAVRHPQSHAAHAGDGNRRRTRDRAVIPAIAGAAVPERGRAPRAGVKPDPLALAPWPPYSPGPAGGNGGFLEENGT